MSRNGRRNQAQLSPTVAPLHGTPNQGGRASAMRVSGHFASPCTHDTMCPTCFGDAHRESFPEFLSAVEVAAALNISPSTLNRWAARRDAGEEVGPPFLAVSDKVRRWSVEELLAWLEAQKR